MLTPDQKFLGIGAYINGALYYAGCIAFGLATNHPWPVRFALAGTGISFLCYFAQIVALRKVAAVLSILSIVAGVISGALLCF